MQKSAVTYMQKAPRFEGLLLAQRRSKGNVIVKDNCSPMLLFALFASVGFLVVLLRCTAVDFDMELKIVRTKAISPCHTRSLLCALGSDVNLALTNNLYNIILHCYIPHSCAFRGLPFSAPCANILLWEAGAASGFSEFAVFMRIASHNNNLPSQ